MIMFNTITQDQIQQLRQLAEKTGIKVEQVMRDDLSAALAGCDPLLAELLEYALFGGGKRIRPLLTILCSRLCGKDDEDLYLLGIAFEYLHVASLAHDDLIDNAEQRRGKPSLAAKYGRTAALLAGDWLLSRSMRLIGRLTGSAGLDIFCRATEGMVDGEFLQLRHTGQPGTTQAQYLDVIIRKTGNLIASTCEIGALYAGAADACRKALRLYGEYLGTAFQIIDDVLDYQGETKETGKATGNDFLEGKMTLPLIQAMAAATPDDQRRLLQLICGDRTTTQSYLQTKELIEHYNGLATAVTTAREFTAKALDALARTKSEDQVSQLMLQTLAVYIVIRKK
ncbi:MAG: geranyl transferase [Desulfobulbus propionicus]|nr:MAG: geranyl transferase [Desulfobulbus propionicus]